MTTADQEFIVIAVGAVAALWGWLSHRTSTIREKQEECLHPPEAQGTARVNNILTMNPALLHAVIPGRRWLTKYCRLCGKQRNLYRSHLQPYDEYLAEYRQETIDREVEFEARKRRHEQELEQKRLQEERKRQRNL